MTKSIVRIATPEDHHEIWRLFLQGHKENGLFTLAHDKVQWFLSRALAPHTIAADDVGPRGVVGVIGEAGALEGLVFITIGEYWYSHDKHIEEFIVYVDPDHRQSNHAQALVAWMKEQADATGLPLMTGIISNKRTEAKCRLYRRMLPKVGEFFLYTTGKGAGAQLAKTASS